MTCVASPQVKICGPRIDRQSHEIGAAAVAKVDRLFIVVSCGPGDAVGDDVRAHGVPDLDHVEQVALHGDLGGGSIG